MPFDLLSLWDPDNNENWGSTTSVLGKGILYVGKGIL